MKTTNEINKLEYGMKILYPCRPISHLIPMMGVALTSSDTPTEDIILEVCKYWESDDDANSYKVTLKPIEENDKLRFGYEKLYSCDLLSLIRRKTCSVILD